jgi:hypothetical protein
MMNELKKRKEATKRAAKADLLKSGIVQFRIELDLLDELYKLAESRRMRMGGMVRQWVLERLNDEREGHSVYQTESFIAEPSATYKTGRPVKTKLAKSVPKSYSDICSRLDAVERQLAQIRSPQNRSQRKSSSK